MRITGRFFPAMAVYFASRCGGARGARYSAMVASKKTACSGQGEKQSKVVEQFAKGFVASSAATESEKQAQRTWDRSSLLQVNDDDSQVGIFNAYAQNANTDGEGKSTKRGLGAASAPAAGRRGGMGMMFVSAGGAPAATAAAGGMPSFVGAGGGASHSFAGASHAAAGAGALPPGWVAQVDPRSGAPYYTNVATGVAQWVPPAAAAAIAPPPPPFATPAPPAAPPLPPGWVAGVDPNSGHTYYCNAVRQPA